jgi:hypothetical protein
MIIRSEQLETLEDATMPNFEDSMVTHLKDFSPLHTASLGESGIRTLIQACVARANNLGFTRRGPMQFYVEAAILLGIDFDTDPQYPWPGQILRDRSTPDQMQRADRVHAWLTEFLRAAGGPNREYARHALEKARGLSLEGVPLSHENFAAEVLRRLKETHPEKVTFLGDEVLRGLIPRAVSEATTYNVATDAGVSLFIALMFAVGHGFTRDPKYPWITNTLTNRAISEPAKRVQRLYSKTMTYLDQVLASLDGR